MSKFETSRQIDVPPEHAWAIMADVNRWPEWTASVTGIELLTPLPMSLGSRVRIHQPKLRVAVWEVIQWQPCHRFVWESAQPGIKVAGEHLLEPNPGGCLLTLTLRFEGFLALPIAGLGRNLIKHYMTLEADGLKSRSEL